jgi:hypothetical protein
MRKLIVEGRVLIIASLILHIIGAAIWFGEAETNGAWFIGIFLILFGVVGLIILSLIFASKKVPIVAGIIAILLSLPGMWMWVGELSDYFASLDTKNGYQHFGYPLYGVLVFLGAVIALFIGGVQSIWHSDKSRQ